MDSGLACLVMMARLNGIAADPGQIAHRFGETSAAFGAEQILLAARSIGLKARRGLVGFERLVNTPLPAIALDREGGFFLIARVDAVMDSTEGQVRKALIHDPLVQRPEIIDRSALEARWTGELILVASRASLAGELSRFDFSWFIPAVVKYRRLLVEVLVASFFLQIFALVTPLFFQVVMDKVLVHHGYSTLTVIGVGLLAISVFESLLSGLRTYTFSHTTSRIDIELGARLFRHLLALPLAYFEARRVGDSVARVRELEHIRQFLTGSAVTLVIDLLFSVVFLAVMFHYSGWLTLVVVASLPCYVLLSIALTPALRARLNEKFNRGAENQAFLVESINGIHTLKAMAVEPQMTRLWDNQLASYVASSFRVVRLGTLASESVSLVNDS